MPISPKRGTMTRRINVEETVATAISTATTYGGPNTDVLRAPVDVVSGCCFVCRYSIGHPVGRREHLSTLKQGEELKRKHVAPFESELWIVLRGLSVPGETHRG
ncbi:hypothetical protein RvY_08022 [Ramazzottius varieornatus]|uniref:Uncharacterized protein n=1 Tax=Ramazzottius varieornatus TaxID=947166 RepID=A0A1D1V4A1_RAMVA|nr:hypothetical protein RvY_08022 [Ramazzottius varieornatus]